MYEDVIGKKLLVIGGDPAIANIVEQAKQMGVYTIVTDSGTDLNKLPAKVIADEAWNDDYSDLENLAAKCREAGINGVFSGYSEGKVWYAAKLSELLGTPFYVTPEQVDLTRNKRDFKELCARHDIDIPCEYCKNGKMTEADKDSVKYPVIVKPSDYGGRIGISVCYNREELEEALILAESKSVSGTVVVEEYISGTEITAIYTIADGQYSLSIINDKYLSKEGQQYSCLCDVAVTPSKFHDTYLETTDSKIRSFLEDIGVKNGIAGFQFIVTEDRRIVAFEMGLRLNGGNDWKIIQSCNNINHMKMLIHYSLTGSMGDSLEKDDPVFKNYMATYVLYAHGGKVGTVQYDAVKTHPEIIDISPYVYVGKEIPDKGTTQQRVISFKICAPTLQGMIDDIHFVQENLHILDENGQDMLFTPFDTDRLTALS